MISSPYFDLDSHQFASFEKISLLDESWNSVIEICVAQRVFWSPSHVYSCNRTGQCLTLNSHQTEMSEKPVCDTVSTSSWWPHGSTQLHVHNFVESELLAIIPAQQKFNRISEAAVSCTKQTIAFFDAHMKMSSFHHQHGCLRIHCQEVSHQPRWSMYCRSNSIGGWAPYFSTCKMSTSPVALPSIAVQNAAHTEVSGVMLYALKQV